MFIYDIEILREQKHICQSRYNSVDPGKILKKTIVLFKHGDSLSISKSVVKAWKHRNCIQCKANICNLSKCNPGDLTVKGYEQINELGRFIRKTYMAKLESKPSILAFRTEKKTTQASLMALVEYLDTPTNFIRKQGYGSSITACDEIKKDLIPESTMQVLEDQIENELVSSLCNDVPLECDRYGCSPVEIEHYLNEKKLDFEDHMAKIRENQFINGLEFGPIAEIISESLEAPENIVLLPSDGKSIYRFLNGLNIPINKKPSYAESIFVELWKSKEDTIEVRIIQNDEVVRPYNILKDFIPLKNFKKTLSLFSLKYRSANKVCSIEKIPEDDNSRKTLKEYKKSILEKVYKNTPNVYSL